MNNIIEYLKLKTQNKESGFKPSDFSLLGLDQIPSEEEIISQNEEYTHHIKELMESENPGKKPCICGEGIHKKGFLINPNKILLKSDTKVAKPSQAFFNALALKKFGVNIAMPLLFTTESSVYPNKSHPYYSFEVQEEAKGSFVNVLRSDSLIEHITSSNHNITMEYFKDKDKSKVRNQFNLAMTKHRAKTGMPFIKDYMFDFSTLKILGFKDLHTENVFYSSQKGYTFFDIDQTNFLFDDETCKHSEAISKIKEKLENHSNQPSETIERDFISCMISALGLTTPYHIAKPSLIRNFAQYVYNGIVTHQLIEAMKTNTPENDCYNPNFPHAKDCALKMESQLNDKSNPILNNAILISPNNLFKLENALIENNTTSLDEIKEEYNLPGDFEFSCIDIPFFLETMKATHEFDFSNPNPTPIKPPTREYIKACDVDGNLEYEMV